MLIEIIIGIFLTSLKDKLHFNVIKYFLCLDTILKHFRTYIIGNFMLLKIKTSMVPTTDKFSATM